MPEIEFVAIADTVEGSRKRLIEVCEAAGAPAPVSFVSYREMLKACRDDLDFVYVSTPHASHAEQAIAVVEAGLDLFLEKPMVTNGSRWGLRPDFPLEQNGYSLNRNSALTY